MSAIIQTEWINYLLVSSGLECILWAFTMHHCIIPACAEYSDTVPYDGFQAVGQRQIVINVADQ